PWGSTGVLAPPAASASRAGCAAGARGRGRRRVGGGREAKPGAARREHRRQPQPEHSDPPYAQRSPALPPGGVGGDRKPSRGRSAAAPVLTARPPGGRMGEARRSVRASAFAPTTGGRKVAWQPSSQRGQPSGDTVSAAALTGPLHAALTGHTVATER